MKPTTFRKIGGVVIASTLVVGPVACADPEPSASLPSPTPQSTVSLSAHTKPTDQSQVTIDGFGSIRIGMTVDQASKAAGTRLVSLSSGEPAPASSCQYVKLQGGPKGIDFMVIEGRIARVDVSPDSRITTQSGAKVGDTEAQIKALYPGQIEVSPHKYNPNGHYLTFVPKDSKNSNYRLVFETDGDARKGMRSAHRVTSFRAGKLPEVGWVERCG